MHRHGRGPEALKSKPGSKHKEHEQDLELDIQGLDAADARRVAAAL
eukprot:SAG22_NODE_3324_length_1778_cov_1.742108_3_plen_45_part_01